MCYNAYHSRPLIHICGMDKLYGANLEFWAYDITKWDPYLPYIKTSGIFSITKLQRQPKKTEIQSIKIKITLTPHCTKKLPPKWITSLNVTTKTIKHRRNIRKYFCNLGLESSLKKIWKTDKFILNFWNFCSSKDNVKKMKKASHRMEENTHNIYIKKTCILNTANSTNNSIRRQSNFKMFKRYTSQRKIYNQPINTWKMSISLVIQKIQNKTTIRCRGTVISMA